MVFIVLQENSHRPNSRAFIKCINTENNSKTWNGLETGNRERSERKLRRAKKHDETMTVTMANLTPDDTDNKSRTTTSKQYKRYPHIDDIRDRDCT